MARGKQVFGLLGAVGIAACFGVAGHAQTSSGAKFVSSGAGSGFKAAVNVGIQTIGIEGSFRFNSEASKWQLQRYTPGEQALYLLEDAARAAMWSVPLPEGAAFKLGTAEVEALLREHALDNAPFGVRRLVGDLVISPSLLAKQPVATAFLAEDAEGQRWAVRLSLRYRAFEIALIETSFPVAAERDLASLEAQQARLHDGFWQDLTVSIPVKVNR